MAKIRYLFLFFIKTLDIKRYSSHNFQDIITSFGHKVDMTIYMLNWCCFFDKFILRGLTDGKFSVKSPRGVHHPDSDLSVIRYIGLFCPRKKLVKAKKLYSQNFSKYAPLKSDRVFSSFVIIRI